MRFVIQRVTEASVRVEGKVIGEIRKGYLVLIGVSDSDTEQTADKMIRKMIGLRIFEDENGKTNLSLADVDGSLLLVSQFTLYANCKKGNRPSFIEAGAPDRANELYEYIISECKKRVAPRRPVPAETTLFRMQGSPAYRYSSPIFICTSLRNCRTAATSSRRQMSNTPFSSTTR